MRDILAENVMQTAFVPTYIKAREKDIHPEKFLRIIFTIFLCASVVLTILGIIFTPQIVSLIAYGFRRIPDKFTLTVKVTRLTFPFLILVSVSAFFQAVLNAFKRFFAPAISPTLFNISIVSLGIAAYFILPQNYYIWAIAAGVILGGIIQLSFLLFQIALLGIKPKITLTLKHPLLRQFGKLLVPVFLSTAFTRITLFVNTLIASFLREGSVAYLNYAFRIMHLPIGLFAVGVQTVSMPSITEAVTGDRDVGEPVWKSITYNILFTLPASLFILFDAHLLVKFLFERGAFKNLDTLFTSQALVFYALTILPTGISKVFLNYYYATSRIRIPNITMAVAALVNVLIALTLSKTLSFPALALATASGVTLQAVILTLLVSRELPSPGDFPVTMVKIIFQNLFPTFLIIVFRTSNPYVELLVDSVLFGFTWYIMGIIFNFLPSPLRK